MENSPALFIIGTLLVLTLTFTTGSYIQKSAESTIEESLSSMSTQEIEAFNNQFESYLGKQTGSQISSLCGRLIANASSNSTGRDNPDVKIDKLNAGDSAGVEANIYTEYINKLTKIIPSNPTTNIPRIQNASFKAITSILYIIKFTIFFK